MIYSSEDSFFDSSRNFLVDANVLIAFFDTKHTFHKKVYDRLTTVYLTGADFYYVQPCLLEFKEYWRRKKISEYIEFQFNEGYYFYKKFAKVYKDHRETNARWQSLYLTDQQIKSLRATLENVADGKGVQYWFELCEKALHQEGVLNRR